MRLTSRDTWPKPRNPLQRSNSGATLAAQLGATLAELQARIGHSTPNMAMRYQHVAAERDAQLAARMSAFALSWTSLVPSMEGGE